MLVSEFLEATLTLALQQNKASSNQTEETDTKTKQRQGCFLTSSAAVHSPFLSSSSSVENQAYVNVRLLAELTVI